MSMVYVLNGIFKSASGEKVAQHAYTYVCGFIDPYMVLKGACRSLGNNLQVKK